MKCKECGCNRFLINEQGDCSDCEFYTTDVSLLFDDPKTLRCLGSVLWGTCYHVTCTNCRATEPLLLRGK